VTGTGEPVDSWLDEECLPARSPPSSAHRGLKKSTMNLPSESRTASIGNAMIHPHDAIRQPYGIFGKDRLFHPSWSI
jgi:hypothetical protein